MCTTCGCGPGEIKIETGKGHAHPHTHADGTSHAHHHDHEHDHGRGHSHDHHHHDHSHAHHQHGDVSTRTVQLERDILAKNQRFADKNRAFLRKNQILSLNLMSSPGSGKTTLLVETLKRMGETPASVIEGDQQTSNDAERIRATGRPAIQINTGKGCHLEAHAVGHAMEHLDLAPRSILFIENVGNLVCPAAFDLGEAKRVVLLSVTEGEDKPIKYPDMFAIADVVVLTKVDLAPHVDLDMEALRANVKRINPRATLLETSIRGEGLKPWL
ncbi:MAG: hydrogenase nickel incorporation protein HypB, partial [Proteobacteria bacterium]|nr:hydrogenase nickel incorporation protein HypB [Pseudomonadota bacterium]